MNGDRCDPIYQRQCLLHSLGDPELCRAFLIQGVETRERLDRVKRRVSRVWDVVQPRARAGPPKSQAAAPRLLEFRASLSWHRHTRQTDRPSTGCSQQAGSAQ